MSFLIFSTEDEAHERTEQAGKDANLGYHSGDLDGCRYVWPIIVEPIESPRAALDIESHEHLLTEGEKENLAETLPADWQQQAEK